MEIPEPFEVPALLDIFPVILTNELKKLIIELPPLTEPETDALSPPTELINNGKEDVKFHPLKVIVEDPPYATLVPAVPPQNPDAPIKLIFESFSFKKR